MRRLPILLLGLVAVASCGGDGAPEVSMTEIQVLGSHNSYHRRAPQEVLDVVAAFDPDLPATLDYEHPPLTEQLSALGARQLELDVFADPEGGRYARRQLTGEVVPELEAPGFKVLHVQEVDFASTCPTFVACLTEVRDWSLDHDDHVPILVLVEVKDGAIPGFDPPVQVDAALLDDLDAEIRSVFDDDHLLRPGIEAWPSLDDARGKVFLALDNTDDIRDAYRGDVLFTDGDGMFRKLNDPIAQADEIRRAVEAGQVVRTRADADTEQARSGDTAMRDAALASGAQYVSTDYLRPDPRFTDYSVSLPDGVVARCNPVSAPDDCPEGDLE